MKIVIVVIVVLVLLVVGGLFFLGQQSRSGSAPGLTDGRLAACPSSPNCVSSEAGSPAEQRVELFPADAWQQIPAAIADLGGSITQQESDYISAEFTSNIFRFTDDVEFRRAEDAVHVRSASRVGHSDMGANRARVEALRERLEDR